MSRTSRLYWRMTLAVQNRADFVCAGVRVVLVVEPTALISSNCWTQAALSSDGGGGGRNRSALGTTNVRTSPTHGVCGAAYAGGVSRHTPGPGVRVGNVVVTPIGVRRPSPARMARSWVADACPTPIPSVLAWPSGMAASDAVRLAPRAPACAGNDATSVSYAASIAAASAEAPAGAAIAGPYGTACPPIATTASYTAACV